MTHAPWFAALSLLTASAPVLPPAPEPLPARSDCELTDPREAVVDASGATSLRLVGAAGSLRVQGRTDVAEVRVRGVACADRRDDLDQIQLVAERRGDEVVVEAVIPERGWGSGQRRLDLVLELPAALLVHAVDSSGEAEFRQIAALDLRDSSGSLVVEDVAGPVRIDDSSGGIHVRGVRGDLLLRDSSGGIDVAGVDGDVLVERDSSGGIRVADVTGSVVVERDSSGGIRAERIGGDFRVERDGSGSIRYQDVAGQVQVPGGS